LDVIDFSFIFTPPVVDTYEIIGSILYESKSTEPEKININVECAMRGDARPCDSLVDDLELLPYMNRWGQGEVENYDVLEAIENWITYGGCEMKGDTSPCDSEVSDIELLSYMGDWVTGGVTDSDLLETIDNWVGIG